MKKIYISLVSIVLCSVLVLSGCSSNIQGKNHLTETSYNTVPTIISGNHNNFCTLYADVTLHCGDDGELLELYIDNPTVLAFQVSDEYIGGMGIMNGMDVEKVIAILENYIDQSNAGDANIEDIYFVLEIMRYVPIITNAST